MSEISEILKRLVLILIIFFSSCKEEIHNTAITNNDVDPQLKEVLDLLEGTRSSALSNDDKKEIVVRAIDLSSAYSMSDSLKAISFQKIAFRTIRIDSVLFRKASRLAFKYARQTKDSVLLGNNYWDLGDYHRRYFQQDSAYLAYSEAQKIFRKLNNIKNVGDLFRSMAYIQMDIKDYVRADQNLIKAVRIYKDDEDLDKLRNIYINIAVNNKDLKKYDVALQYFELAEELTDKDNPKSYATLYNSFGNLYRNLGEYDKASDYYLKALSNDSLNAVDQSSYASALNNFAYSNLLKGKIDSVEKNLLTSSEIRKELKEIPQLAGSYKNLTEYYLSMKDTTLAKAYADSSLSMARQSDNIERILEILRLKEDIYPDSAIFYAREHRRLNDSLVTEERKIQEKFARLELETDEYIAQAEILAQEKRLWIMVTGGIGLFALSIFVIIYQQIRNQRLRFRQQQQETNQEIFNLMLSQNEKIEEGKQKEQKRISEELHDGVLGAMNGIRMVLLGLNKKADDAAILLREQALQKLQEVQEEIRGISHELSDAAYQKFHNFIVSLEELIEGIEEANALKTHFNYNEDVEWDTVGGEIKINLYRIIQECLMNTVKHAEAQNAYVTLDLEMNSIIVRIRDDGKGFVTRKGKKGIGQKNISSRVKTLNGQWEIKSSPGNGTTVEIKVPYTNGFEKPEPEDVSRVLHEQE